MSFYLNCIKKIFSKDGILVSKFNMEHRPQQEKLALKIAESFQNENNNISEAGTGVGKSLAYLIPGIIWSMITNRKFVVSTHTKNLQDQLIQKDLPFIRTVFKSDPEYFEYAKFIDKLLVGKGNYLCTNRLNEAIIKFNSIGADEIVVMLEAILAETSNPKFDGIRDHLSVDIPDTLWSEINADSSLCNYKRCSDTECYHIRAKMDIDNANIIVANHSLVFSLIAAGTQIKDGSAGVLFENDFIVFDEGHKICEVATNYFGNEITNKSIDILLNQVISNCKKGFPFQHLNHEHIKDLIDTAKNSVNTFFKQIDKYAFKKNDKPYLHLRKPDWINAEYVLKSIKSVINHLKSDIENSDSGDSKVVANDIIKKLVESVNVINEIIALEHSPLYVYWIEKNNNTIKLVSKPVDVSEHLSAFVFDRDVSVIITSATLFDETKTCKRFIESAGVVKTEKSANRLTILKEDSPFDYNKNMEVFILTDAPDFVFGDNSENEQYNIKMIKHFVDNIDGGTMVLCTSYQQCIAIGEAIEELVPDRNVYIQGRKYKRSEMVKRFKKDENAILFGVSSFWTGVDIQGKALSQIIILKMPFVNPDFPLIKAKSELLEECGKSPFFDLLVPEAIMQFRQGLGRLIRSTTDKGRLVVSDSRLVKKSYGKSFFSVIPSKNRKMFKLHDL
jgi:ATP-dependent DNA helicase DinG